MTSPRALRDDARAWCADRLWTWRVPLLAALAYVGWRHLADPDYSSLFSGVIFGSHEFGHLVFALLGEFADVAGGSVMQLLLPGLAAVLLVRTQRDYFGAAVCGVWLSASLSNLAVYVGDARAQGLDLLGFSPDPVHDWNYLLSHFGLLASDTALARLVRAAALVSLILSLALGTWLCAVMAAAQRAKGDERLAADQRG